MRMLKAILFLILLSLICSIGYSQPYSWSGNVNQFSGYKGGTGADSCLAIAVDTTYWKSANVRMNGRVAVKDGIFYWYDSLQSKWVSPLSNTTPSLQDVCTINDTTETGMVVRGMFVANRGRFGTAASISDLSYAPIVASLDSTDMTSLPQQTIQSTARLGFTSTVTGTSHTAYTAVATVKNTNTADWNITGTNHPMLRGFSSSVGIDAGAIGTIGYAACYYGSLSGAVGATMTNGTLETLTFGHIGAITYARGLFLNDIDAGANNVALHIENGNEAAPPNGNWSIYSKIAYPSYFQDKIQIGSETSIGSNALEVTGKQVSTDIDNYTENIASSYTSRTKVDKNYVDSSTSSLSLQDVCNVGATYNGNVAFSDFDSVYVPANTDWKTIWGVDSTDPIQLSLMSWGGYVRLTSFASGVSSGTGSYSNPKPLVNGSNAFIIAGHNYTGAVNGTYKGFKYMYDLAFTGTETQDSTHYGMAFKIRMSKTATTSLYDALYIDGTGKMSVENILLKYPSLTTNADSNIVKAADGTFKVTQPLTPLINAKADTATTFKIGGNYVSATCTLGTRSNNNFSFITNDIQRMLLATSGRFFIGSTTVGALGTNGINFHLLDTGNVAMKIANSYTGGTTNDGFELGVATGATGNAFLNMKENLGIDVLTNATSRGGWASDGSFSNTVSLNTPKIYVSAPTSYTTGFTGYGVYSTGGELQSRATIPVADVTGAVSGSGTTNTLSMFTGSTAIGNSIISQSGSTATIAGYLAATGGSLASGANALSITGSTLSSTAATQTGGVMSVTGAGSGSNSIVGWQQSLFAGYTGSGYSIGTSIGNASVGNSTGTLYTGHNRAASMAATGTTTGANIGSYSEGYNANTNAGIVGRSTVDKNNATNIGVVGVGSNGGTSPVQVGVFGGIGLLTPNTSGAVIADNGASTSPIFLGRDNGTTVFTIADSGTVTSTSTITSTGFKISALQTPPANASATGVTGTIIFGSDGYLYLCTATNTWVRTQLTTW